MSHRILRMAEYEAISDSKGRLIGICPCCEGIINKYTSLAKLVAVQAHLDVTMLKAREHISETRSPVLNSDLN